MRGLKPLFVVGLGREASISELTKRKGKVIIIGSYLRVLGVAVIVAALPFISAAQDNKLPTNQKYIKELIKEFKFKYPDLAFHIYAKESGFGSSRLALEDNNLFGMKYPTKRYTRAIYKTSSGFAGYKSVKDAVLDFKLYELRYLQNKSREEYKRYLRDVYSLDVNYFEKFVGK